MPGALPLPHPYAAPRHPAPGRRPLRLVVPGAIAVAAIAVGGPLGVLLGIAALLVAVDLLIPMPSTSTAQAEERFRRAVRHRRLAAAGRRLRGRAPERLFVLDDRHGWAAVAERRALGIQPVAVASITGTVEERKTRAFDARLRPDAGARDTWRGVWLAQARGEELPPISVYRVGTHHVLRDGHHRASAAADHGLPVIDADVIELRPRPMAR